MSATAEMSAIAWMQATAVTPAISNSKDDSKSMTAHNSRNESNNRTANTVWTQAKAGMYEYVLKPATACREAYYSKDKRNIIDVNSSRTARIRM
jgi:hypothetical protein